jgi:hypothetical protein
LGFVPQSYIDLNVKPLPKRNFNANDLALLLKLSRKRLQEALQNAGLTDEIIGRYLLAWKCFTDGYILSKSPNARKLQRPDGETWETIKIY